MKLGYMSKTNILELLNGYTNDIKLYYVIFN
jgi:hypothetical protein